MCLASRFVLRNLARSRTLCNQVGFVEGGPAGRAVFALRNPSIGTLRMKDMNAYSGDYSMTGLNDVEANMTDRGGTVRLHLAVLKGSFHDYLRTEVRLSTVNSSQPIEISREY